MTTPQMNPPQPPAPEAAEQIQAMAYQEEIHFWKSLVRQFTSDRRFRDLEEELKQLQQPEGAADE